MTGVSDGRPTTDDDRYWKKFGDTFTPDKELEFLTGRAEKIVGQTALIGTILGAGGLVAISTILTNPVAQYWAVWAVAAAGAAVLLALVTQIRWVSRIRPGNIRELRAWFEQYTGWRRYSLSIASLLLVIAFLLAATSVAFALNADQRQPSVGLVTIVVPGEDGGPATLKVTATAELTAGDGSDSARAVLKSNGEPVATSSVDPGADLSMKVTLEAEGLASNSQITFTLDSTSWSCEVKASSGAPETTDCSAVDPTTP